MSKLTNLAEFLLGIANKLRTYLPAEGKINPQSFEDKIDGVYNAGVGNLQVKEISPEINEQVITPDEGYRGMSQVICGAVTSSIDENITPSNIKDGVTILGITGTLEESGTGQTGDVGDVFYIFPFKTELTVS